MVNYDRGRAMDNLKDMPPVKLEFLLYSFFLTVIIIHIIFSFKVKEKTENIDRRIRRMADCTEKIIAGSVLIGLFQSNNDAIFLSFMFTCILMLLELLLDE